MPGGGGDGGGGKGSGGNGGGGEVEVKVVAMVVVAMEVVARVVQWHWRRSYQIVSGDETVETNSNAVAEWP